MDGLVAVVFMVVALFLIVRTFVLKGREARATKEGDELAAAGDHKGALAKYAEAHASWGLNVAHATPAQFAKDLNRLRDLLRKMASEGKSLGKSISIASAENHLVQAINILSNKENLTAISGNLDGKAQAQFDKTLASLKGTRRQIQKECGGAAID